MRRLQRVITEVLAQNERFNTPMLPPPTPVSASSSLAGQHSLPQTQATALQQPGLSSPASTTSVLRSPAPRALQRAAPQPLNLRHSWGTNSIWSPAPSSAGSEDVPPSVRAIIRKLVVLKAEINDKLWDLRRSMTAEGVEAVQTATADGIAALIADLRVLSTQFGL